MAYDIARYKTVSRQALHRALAASAVYADSDVSDKPVKVRWHNKLARAGALEGGFDTEIIEGIDRLVFQQSDLALNSVTLKHGGTVTLADFDAVFSLEAEEPPDGPENIYWTVSRVT